MPSFPIIVTEESWSLFLHIKVFIQSEPADLGLLGLRLPSFDSRYQVRLNSFYGSQDLSLFDLCSLYGKTEHLNVLPWNDTKKKAAVKGVVWNNHQKC